MTSAVTSTNPSNQPNRNPAVNRSTSIESEICKAMFENSQRDHLSGSLFPLNNILIHPRLLASIHIPSPDDQPQYVPILYQTLPNLYDSPELAGGFPYPTISLEKAIQWTSRVAVSGFPGSGKSTALLALAARISKRDPSLGTLSTTLPVYMHCRNLNSTNAPVDSPFQPLLRYLALLTKKHDEKALHSTLIDAAREDRLILMLDGLEELTPPNAAKTVRWVSQLLKSFPSLKIIFTVIPNYSPSLSELGFQELSMALWSDAEKLNYVELFSLAWYACFQQKEESAFITRWLKTSKLPSSPLEMTLCCWSAFTGNAITLQGTEIFTPYLRSITDHPLGAGTLQSLAEAEVRSAFAGFAPSEAESIIGKDPLFTHNVAVDTASALPSTGSSPIQISGPTTRSVFNELLKTGILDQNLQGRIIYKSDHLCAALYAQQPDVQFPNNWRQAFEFSFTDSLLLFASASKKSHPRILQWLNEMDYPLFRNDQVISHWLTTYPSLKRDLLVNTFKKIIPVIQKSSLPISLQIKLLKPLLLSHETATFSFFKEMAASPNAIHRQTAAFCLSYYFSAESDALLISLSADQDHNVQKLACIALAKSWSSRAQKQLVNLVMTSDPEIRQIIGELFALIPGDGHELLKELAVLPDNPEARKAAVDGLLLVNAEWSRALLKKVNIEDTEWLVRDTAANAIKLNNVDHLLKPKRSIAPSYLPWLIKFAASRRMGVYANEFPTDILLLAIKEGDPQVRLAALETLASDSSPEAVRFLKQAFLHARGPIQELAYSGLVTLAKKGIDLQK